MKYIKKLVLSTFIALNFVEQPAPEVAIEQGNVSGKISKDGSFFEYTGIPYATHNISNRFQAPLPPPKWTGTFKAIDEIYECPQKSRIGVIGVENCLKINVYVPATARRPLPVMVYVHGGAFITGNGGKLMYAPEFLVKHDVILVTFNYRMGALGFMCLGIKEAPGNAALKDQVAALRWVKKNIAAFGGDPDNITIFGESAGGTSVSLLLASPVTEGLFNRAIMQSGSGLANWAINREPVWTTHLMAKTLGYDIKDPYDLYQLFSTMPYKELVNITVKKPLDIFYDTGLIHLPCVEKEFPGEEAVLTDVPYNLIKNNPKNIPIMMGSTSKEGLLVLKEETPESLESRNGRYLFASDLGFESETIAQEEALTLQKFYFDNDPVSFEKLMNVSEMYTHLYFEIPAVFENELYMSKINSPIYNYYFDYSGDRNFLKYLLGFQDIPGACHADELMYLFKGRIWPFLIKKEDQKMIDWMTKMWTNFAKYEDPTPSFDSELPVKWVPRSESGQFLYIQNELSMGPMPNPKAYRIWKHLYDNYRRKKYENSYKVRSN